MAKRMIVIGMLCISLLLVQFNSAAAEADTGDTQIYETAFTNTNTSLSGIRTSKQLYFQLEDYWKIKDVKITLDYQVTPLTRDERSSMTFVMNGTKFHSFRPNASEGGKQRVTVSVPLELLLDGNNTLTVEGYIETTLEEQLCIPVEKRDNWLQLYDTSGIAVSYTNEAFDGSISDFHSHFIGLDTVSANQNAIVLPVLSEPAEIEAAVHALSGFAKANPLNDKAIPMMTFGSEHVQDKKFTVAIALYDHLPEGIKNVIGSKDLSNEALIQVLNIDKQSTLVITSASPELLEKAGRLMANQQLVKQLNGKVKVVDASTAVDTPTFDVNRNVILTEAGDQLTGAMHQEKTYFISLPANRTIADASKINLDIRYAQNLDFDRSMVTVLINDTPIGSKKLTSELADGDTVTLPIPKNLDITGNFSVTVAFDLELHHASCIQLQDQMPWAYITKDSVLQLNTKDKTELLFNNYPYPYLRDGSFNQIAVVVPQEKDAYTYLAISNIFNLLGQYAEGNTGDVRFYEDGAADVDLRDRNVIAIGTYANNKIIQEQNDKLYFQYDSNGAGFISNEKMSIDADYGKRLGTLQLIESPYQAGRGLLAITGASSEYYYLSSKLLSSESTKWKVYGDGVVTDKDGNINAFRFKKQAEQEPTSFVDDMMKRPDVLSFMIVAISVAALVLISLLLMIRKYRKKRGESDET